MFKLDLILQIMNLDQPLPKGKNKERNWINER